MSDIHEVAVIGGGPAGICTVNELLNTGVGGVSTVGTGSRPANPQFTKVVVFEQKHNAGGVWNIDEVEQPDEFQENLFKKPEYYNAEVIHPRLSAPSELDIAKNTVDSPLVVEAADNSSQWRKSAIYPDLYSNVPTRFVRFSSIKYEDAPVNKDFKPLLSFTDISQLLKDFNKKNDLLKHFRFNTQVQNVEQDEKDNKWILTLRKSNPETGKDEWYQEKFDAVIVASGHYQTPYIPYIEGLETRKANSIIHSKAFRSAEEFKDENVLLVGSSLSGIDIVQYIEPYAKSLTISRSPGKEEILPWLTRAAVSYPNKPRISKINGSTVEFVDGTKLENVDKIVFATGYHWHYPFLSEKYLKLTRNGHNNTTTNSSRVEDLYLHTFSMNYPTLAFAGVTLTSFKFHTIEISAAAIAGVWSNAHSLPSKEEQKKWELERLNETANNVAFHFYMYDEVSDKWGKDAYKYAAKNRAYPLDNEDLGDMVEALKSVEYFFYKTRDDALKKNSKPSLSSVPIDTKNVLK